MWLVDGGGEEESRLRLRCDDGRTEGPMPFTWCSEASFTIPPLIFLAMVTLAAMTAGFRTLMRDAYAHLIACLYLGARTPCSLQLVGPDERPACFRHQTHHCNLAGLPCGTWSVICFGSSPFGTITASGGLAHPTGDARTAQRASFFLPFLSLASRKVVSRAMTLAFRRACVVSPNKAHIDFRLDHFAPAALAACIANGAETALAPRTST